MAKKKQKFLVLPDGTEEKVLKETGKYFVCDGRMFRKSNDSIRVESRVDIREEEKKEEERGEE